MKTDELIAILSQDKTPRKPYLTLGFISVVVLVLNFVVTKFWLGLRPELDALTLPVSFWFKTLVLAALIVISLQALSASALPMRQSRLRVFPILFVAFFAASLAYEWTIKTTTEIEHLFFLPNFQGCLIYTTLFGSGISFVLFAAVKKRAAPLKPGLTAGFIGLVAACIGGLGYSIHCPIDSPTFILVAYGLPQLTLYFAGRFLFTRFLRW